MVDPTINSTTPVRTIAPSSPSESTPPSAPDVAKTAQAKKPAKPRKPRNFSSAPFWSGLVLSLLWIGAVAFAMVQSGGNQSFAGLPLSSWAIGISAIVSPIAMIWMVTAYLQRAADVQSVTEPLRRQLAMILGESGIAEIRIRRFNQAIREQLDLLRSTQSINQNELMAILERVNQHKEDLEQFEQHSLYQVKEIQDVIRNGMTHIEKVMDDKFTLLRVLDGKLVQSGDSISRQTDYVREQVTGLLHEIESNAHQVSSALERSLSDSKKLADTARAQETSLISAAESASSTLQDLSGRLDLNIAHFLEHAGSAHREAEKLAGVLDAQTRSLDEFSNTLPARVSEAEAVLHGVADRLYASEQLAREQALNLSEKLAAQIDNLEQTMNRFTARFNDIDSTMQQRRTDLDGLVVRVSGSTNDLAQQLDGTINAMGDRAQAAMNRFAAVNDEARRNTDDIISRLSETAARYEGATMQLSTVSEANAAQLHRTTGEIAAQLAQFEALHNAAERAAADVQTRASSALQNMQHVLERLLATRDATQSVGDTLTEKMRAAIEQNERAIARINEATRMTVQALGSATDAMARQEGEIGSKAAAAESSIKATIADLQSQAALAEKSMREQNTALTSLLKETQSKLDAAETRLENFAVQAPQPVQKLLSQMEMTTDQGRDMLGRMGESVQGQIDRLQQISGRVGQMGQEVGAIATSTLGSLEQLNGRFTAIKTVQEETVRATMDSIASLADRLKTETSSLDSEAKKAVSALEQTATQVSAQAQGMDRQAQETGAKIHAVTTALQDEAATMRSVLEKQAEDLRADLAKAERQFTDLGETLKQKTDAAYALMSRVAAHTDEITRSSADVFETHANKLGLKATEAHGKVDALNTTMQRQIELIATNALQVEKHAAILTDTGAKATDQLATLNATIMTTQDSAVSGATKVIAKMEEAGNLMQKQSDGLTMAGDSAATSVQKAGTLFGEQASKLLDTNQLVEQSLRSLNAATSAFSDQSAQIRGSMEQHNQRLVTSLTETVGKLANVETAFQQTLSTAMQGADKTAARFSEMTATASAKIGANNKDLIEAASKTEATLGALGAHVTQQVASLSLLGDQIREQHNALAKAADAQKSQMLDLFDRLGTAHMEASDVADRTIQHLGKTLDQIQAQLGALSDHAQTSVANVRDASGNFADQAGLLIQHAQQAEQQARAVLTVTSSLQDQAANLRTALQVEAEKADEKLGSLLSKLNQGSADIRSISTAAEATISSLQTGMSTQTSGLNDMMERIADRQRNLTVTLETQRETLNGLVTRLGLAADETAQAGERSATRLGESVQQIVHQMDAMDQQTKGALESIHAASTGFANEVVGLGQHANEAEKLARMLLANSAGLQDNAQQLCTSLRTESDRAAGSLENLVGKLSTGTTAVRDTGSIVEATLGSLHEKLVAESSELTSKMGEVNASQQTLTSALEAQRDTLSGLVSRLTVAQDETAATAERSALRIADSTQQHARQIDTIESKAKTAVDVLHTATGELIKEAAKISDETAKAEGHVRTILAGTASMQDQARQLRDTLQTEAGQVSSQIGNVVGRLDSTIATLKDQSAAAVNVMDKTVQSYKANVEATNDSLQKQSDKLASVADMAEKRIVAASDKVRDHFKTVADSGDITEQTAQRLSVSAEKATSQLVALCTTMTEGDKEAKDILANATSRLSQTKETLQRELQTVAELSLQAIEQVMAAGKTLATESDALRANLASSESALASAAELVRDEAVQVPSVLDRSTSRIEAAGKTFLKETDAINASILHTTDRYITTAGAVRDTMVDEAQNLAKVATHADQILKAFNQALVEKIAALHAGNGKLSVEQEALVEKANASLAQLSAASERLAKMRIETQHSAEKLVHEFDVIDAKASSSVTRLNAAGETLSKQIVQLGQNADRAETQLGSASQTFREQLEKVRAGVQSEIEGINRGLMQIMAQLERTGTTLRSATTNTVADIEKIAGRFDQTSTETANQMADRTARMHQATEEVAKLLGGFGDQIDVLLDRMSLAGDGLKRHESDLVNRLQQVFTHIGSIREGLESSRALASNVTDEAVSKLSSVAKAVETQMKGLADGANTVTEIVHGVTKTYADQTQTVTRNIVDAQGQILSMNKSVEEMQQRTDRMRVTLKLQGDDLLSSLEQILHQLSSTGDAMGDTVDQVLQQQAAQGLKHLG